MRKVAIVTGGTRGIGFAIAQQMIKAGFITCIMSRSAEEVCADALNALRATEADVTPEVFYMAGGIGVAADREAFLCEHLWELDEIPSSEGIRTERWKYMRYRFIPGREELYDLAADSEEAVNLASDPAYGRTLEELRRECNRQIERYVSLRRH